jgi:ribosomal protein L22
MTPDSPKDPQKGEAEVPEEVTETTASEEQPKPKRARAKKPAEPKAEAEATAEKPKPKRTRAKKPATPKAAEPAAEADEAAKAEADEAEAPVADEPQAAEEAPKEEPKPAARPARRRDRRQPAEPGVLVRAQAKYVRTSARKARLVCDHIRGKDVVEARAILAFTPRGAAKPWLKLLESAVANAEHNHELVGDDLRIAAVHADEGPTLKRYRPRAMGRATRIRKRTSHLTITLTPKES